MKNPIRYTGRALLEVSILLLTLAPLSAAAKVTTPEEYTEQVRAHFAAEEWEEGKRLLDEAAQLSRESMTVYAVAAGVDPDCVFKDHAGLDTYSTMYRAKEIFQAEKVVVVTQAFHVSRAVYLARSLGLEAYGVACDRGEYTHKVRNELRETLARVKAVWSAVTQPEPKFLGDAIPIWGPGSATDDEYDRAESDGKEA